jgi:hypothetical protein
VSADDDENVEKSRCEARTGFASSAEEEYRHWGNNPLWRASTLPPLQPWSGHGIKEAQVMLAIMLSQEGRGKREESGSRVIRSVTRP